MPAELIERHGAVSAEVAAAMARGARERLGAGVAVSVTGIAGPGGGTAEKPVGLVYVHAEGPDGGLGREFSFPGDRASIRARSVVIALHLVRTLLTVHDSSWAGTRWPKGRSEGRECQDWAGLRCWPQLLRWPFPRWHMRATRSRSGTRSPSTR